MSMNAIVARSTDHGLAFLARHGGRVDWTTVDDEAAVFQSIRDATRAAMRLPGRFRAFALPGASGWRAGA